MGIDTNIIYSPPYGLCILALVMSTYTKYNSFIRIAMPLKKIRKNLGQPIILEKFSMFTYIYICNKPYKLIVDEYRKKTV